MENQWYNNPYSSQTMSWVVLTYCSFKTSSTVRFDCVDQYIWAYQFCWSHTCYNTICGHQAGACLSLLWTWQGRHTDMISQAVQTWFYRRAQYYVSIRCAGKEYGSNSVTNTGVQIKWWDSPVTYKSLTMIKLFYLIKTLGLGWHSR